MTHALAVAASWDSFDDETGTLSLLDEHGIALDELTVCIPFDSELGQMSAAAHRREQFEEYRWLDAFIRPLGYSLWGRMPDKSPYGPVMFSVIPTGHPPVRPVPVTVETVPETTSRRYLVAVEREDGRYDLSVTMLPNDREQSGLMLPELGVHPSFDPLRRYGVAMGDIANEFASRFGAVPSGRVRDWRVLEDVDRTDQTVTLTHHGDGTIERTSPRRRARRVLFWRAARTQNWRTRDTTGEATVHAVAEPAGTGLLRIDCDLERDGYRRPPSTLPVGPPTLPDDEDAWADAMLTAVPELADLEAVATVATWTHAGDDRLLTRVERHYTAPVAHTFAGPERDERA